MTCPEKAELQRRCTAAWDAYSAEAAKLGRGAPAISELVAARALPLLRLRGEHMKASRELSRHLARHRC